MDARRTGGALATPNSCATDFRAAVARIDNTIAIAITKLESEIRAIGATMRRFSLDERFALILIAGNSIWQMTTRRC